MILIVGQYIKDITKRLEASGDSYFILKDQTRYKLTTKHSALCDFSNLDSVMEIIARLPEKPHAVFTVYEKYIRVTAEINEHLGLTHALPLDAAIACTDKYIMRQLFAKAPEPISPAFTEVADEHGLLEFAAAHAFPLILKPANLAKSLLVTKCANQDELVAAYRHSLAEAGPLYQRYTNGLQPRFVVEEFMEGSVHSVDGFADADGNVETLDAVVDYEIAAEVGFDDTFHYSRNLPSHLSPEQQTVLRHTAELGMRALGMRSTPAHVEVIMTATGPRIVEIGARNGGYRVRMHDLANGIDVLGAAMASYQGQLPDLAISRHEGCCVIEVFPHQNGTFTEVERYDELLKLPSLNYAKITKQPGDAVGKAMDGFKACLIVILHNKDTEQLKRDVDFVKTKVSIATT